MSRTTFRDLHRRGAPLVVPNPWDVGSAVILERLGFAALATTSSGVAFAAGRADGDLPCELVIERCREMVDATSIPISADLERGFGDAPDEAAATVALAAAVGLAGCSIEDHTGRSEGPIYPTALAVERVAAAAELARGLDQDFVLTARCERLLWTDADLDEVIGVLVVFGRVGADVVFAPGLRTLEQIAEVCSALTVPVSVGLEMPEPPAIAALAEAGVARVSVGAVFVRAAYGRLVESARELAEYGTMESIAGVIDYHDLESFFLPPA